MNDARWATDIARANNVNREIVDHNHELNEVNLGSQNYSY